MIVLWAPKISSVLPFSFFYILSFFSLFKFRSVSLLNFYTSRTLEMSVIKIPFSSFDILLQPIFSWSLVIDPSRKGAGKIKGSRRSNCSNSSISVIIYKHNTCIWKKSFSLRWYWGICIFKHLKMLFQLFKMIRK